MTTRSRDLPLPRPTHLHKFRDASGRLLLWESALYVPGLRERLEALPLSQQEPEALKALQAEWDRQFKQGGKRVFPIPVKKQARDRGGRPTRLVEPETKGYLISHSLATAFAEQAARENRSASEAAREALAAYLKDPVEVAVDGGTRHKALRTYSLTSPLIDAVTKLARELGVSQATVFVRALTAHLQAVQP